MEWIHSGALSYLGIYLFFQLIDCILRKVAEKLKSTHFYRYLNIFRKSEVICEGQVREI